MSYSKEALEHMNYLSTPPRSLKMFGSKYEPSNSKEPPRPTDPSLLTDCITFAARAISGGFMAQGDSESANRVMKLVNDGTHLAKYLVSVHDWTAIYCNPDVPHPADGNPEHPSTYRTWKNTSKYYEVDTKYCAINYKPTPYDEQLWEEQGWRQPETPREDAKMQAMQKIPFGFGLSHGAYHTWLWSYGQVHDVHWRKRGSELFDVRPFFEFNNYWLSHLVVIPPDGLEPSIKSVLEEN